MSEQMHESLSALMDGEANELELERVLSRIADDPQLRQAWVRYSQAQGALAGQPQAYPQLDISARVRAELDNSAQSVAKTTASFKERVLRPLTSLAVAASVAATVVIGGQQLAQIGSTDAYTNDGVATIPAGIFGGAGGVPVRASLTGSRPVLKPATREAYQTLARQRMSKYMQEHAEHAALNSPQGLIPFARVPEIRE